MTPKECVSRFGAGQVSHWRLTAPAGWAMAQLAILTNLTAPREFVDPDSNQIGSRFYRARLATP